MRSRIGGFINKTTQPSQSSAIGVWTLDESRHWAAAAKWPIRTIAFYGMPSWVDVTSQPVEVSVYYTSDYQSNATRWERRASNSSTWFTVSGETSSTIRLSNGGFFYRMVVTSGIKSVKSPEFEVIENGLANFEWTQHPVNEERPEGNLFYFWADGRAYKVGSGEGPEYYTISGMACQWQMSTNSGQDWSDIPDQTSNVLWLIAGGTNAATGTRYRLRVVVPGLGTYTSNSATLTVV